MQKAKIDRFVKGWVETTLDDLSQINPRETLARGITAPYVAMDRLIPFTRRISGFELKKFKGGTKFRNGDILVARITPCLENGKTSFVDILDEDEVGFGSTEFIVIREKKNKSDRKFLYYFTTSPLFREGAVKSMTGTSGRQRVQTDLMATKLFLFPPLAEQKAIAAVLSSLDDKIELLRRQNETLEQIAQAIFKEWFVEFNFPDKDGKPYKANGGKMIDSELDEIPEGWEVDNLSNIADFLNGLALQKYPPESNQEYLPAIKIRELKQGISPQTDRASTKLDSKYIIQNGDVLFSWSGSLDIVIWKYGRGALNQHLFKVTSEKYPKWFYFYWVKHYLAEFQQIASNKATTMGHIQRHHLDDAKVVIPEDNMLQNADHLFTSYLHKVILNNQQIDTLSQIRDKLLPKLMTGQVRVEDAKIIIGRTI